MGLQLNPEWYVWMLEQQRKYNVILALGTIILSVVGVLQIIKDYQMNPPEWVLFIFGTIIVFCLGIVIATLFFGPPKN